MPIAKRSKTSRKRSTKSYLLRPITGLSKPVILGILVLASTLGVYAVYNASAATGRPDIVAAAKKYVGVQEKPNGCNCGGVINSFTAGHHELWCADFVSYVYHKTGHSFTPGWRIASTISMRSWFIRHKGWHARGSSDTPRPGDAIFFDWSSKPPVTEHVGIVDHVSGSTVYTIEGNTSNGVHRRAHTNYHHDSTVVGWGRM
ncbi:MAG: hypothetical protein JWN01_1105 [Patescibacteria group bacterium]|nr:hypothetical protein [Patescibacteria group bacterium]